MLRLLAVLLLAGPAAAQEFDLTTAAPKTVAPVEVRLASAPFSGGRPKRYRAFPLAALLDEAFGPAWRDPALSVAFKAKDGYEAVADSAKLQEPGPFLAFEDLDVPGGWEPVGHKKADPGPFFLVWTGAGQTTQNEYPWPWQTVKIKLVRFRDQYPAVFPEGAAEGSAAWRGFLVFKGRCLRCHAIDQEGGKIGPDLGAPKNETEYRSVRMLKEFILHPSRYRYTQMPDHEDLGGRGIDDVIAYLRHQAKRPRKSW